MRLFLIVVLMAVAAGLPRQRITKVQRAPLQKSEFTLKSPPSYSKRFLRIDPLGGRLKTGQWWSGQNRPTDPSSGTRLFLRFRLSLVHMKPLIAAPVEVENSSCLRLTVSPTISCSW